MYKYLQVGVKTLGEQHTMLQMQAFLGKICTTHVRFQFLNQAKFDRLVNISFPKCLFFLVLFDLGAIIDTIYALFD